MAATITAKDVSALRGKTGAGMMDCKRALEETGGDIDKAVDLLRKKGMARAEKRAGRAAAEGMIGSYIHFNGKVAVLIEANCETDFVARTDAFQELVRDVAMHVASAKPLAVTEEELPGDVLERERAIIEEQVAESGKPEHVRAKMVEGKLKKYRKDVVLLDQPFVKDDSKTVGDVVKEAAGTLGENVVIRRFVRFELGEQ
jgi:elongation factor Ts